MCRLVGCHQVSRLDTERSGELADGCEARVDIATFETSNRDAGHTRSLGELRLSECASDPSAPQPGRSALALEAEARPLQRKTLAAP